MSVKYPPLDPVKNKQKSIIKIEGTINLIICFDEKRKYHPMIIAEAR